MKVAVKQPVADELRKVKPGECFIHSGVAYMRLDMSDIPVEEGIPVCYFTNLDTGRVAAWSQDTLVTQVTATVEIS